MALLRKCYFVGVIFLVFLIISESATDDSDDYDEEDLTRTYRFPSAPRERPCQYRRQEGVCRRRSECRRPTRHTCRFGLNPIVCCMDRPETTTTTTTRRPTPPKPTRPRPSPAKPDEIQEIDLTFPNCGKRTQKVSEENRRNGAREEEPSSRRRGILSRRGKREVNAYRRLSRRDIIKPIIVGGRDAQSNSWPWMVAVFKTSVPGGPKRFLCGASLVSRQYVVTAAHCFDAEKGNIDPKKFSIVVGSHSTKDGTEYLVEDVLLHPDYKPRQYYNDLCLMKVDGLVKLTEKVYPVCLPSDGLRDKIIPGLDVVTVTGWGDTTFGGVSSQVLQEVEIHIVPLKQCNESYYKVARGNFPKGITNLFICAGEKEGGKDACQGDSGGPMVAKLKDFSWVQLGVVSFGYGCAQVGFPGVYTRLSQYTKWLYDNTDLGRS
ncbi:clotting factor G beta subunit-like [Argiope bruennichi]|uniref:clotting factor G beta subunit-like n=1 Tax=Argiope bruennichi TaxID=94029 RepID=UPI002494C793|nr:clotting factor G beta subunit-like [Argiope bruennichi]